MFNEVDEIKYGSWRSYPKVYQIGHKEIIDIFNSEVIIEEKIDGSQFSFGVFDGELRIRSRGKELIVDAPEKMFNKAVNVVKDLKPLLTNGWTYRAEYLTAPKHNVLAYDRIPANNLMIFDINDGNESYLDHIRKSHEASRLGLESVPILFVGKFTDPVSIINYLEQTSCLGGQKMEGVVVKNYNLFGSDKKVLMGKYVSEAFKEVHELEWKKSNPGKKEILSLLINELKTPARWCKAVQHLKESGVLENSPKDIGKLLIELDKDLKAECIDYISEKLLKWALPHVLRGIKHGFPEWYKKHLLEEAYSNKEQPACQMKLLNAK